MDPKLYPRYFRAEDAPGFVRQLSPERLGTALYYLQQMKQPTGWDIGLPATPDVISTAGRIRKEVYGRFSKKADLKNWVTNYWDWLRRGTPTSTQTPSTEKQVTMGGAGETDLTYVQGVGYVTRADLPNYRAELAARYEEEKRKAQESPEVRPYYETYEATTGKPASWSAAVKHPVFAGKILGQEKFGDWITANRAGNYASTRSPGQVSRTPYASLSSPGSAYAQRVRDRTAKKVGRGISGAGVSRIANSFESYSRKYRQIYGRQ